MGYRPSIVTQARDYGEQISGFNYNADEFETILDELFQVEYINSDSQDNFYEIENSEVEKLKTFEITTEKCKEVAEICKKSAEHIKEIATTLKNSLIRALDTDYSKKLGYVAIEWF